MLFFESLTNLTQQTKPYSKSTTETLKQDFKSVKSYDWDCVSLITNCNMSMTFFKCYSAVLLTCLGHAFLCLYGQF